MKNLLKYISEISEIKCTPFDNRTLFHQPLPIFTLVKYNFNNTSMNLIAVNTFNKSD